MNKIIQVRNKLRFFLVKREGRGGKGGGGGGGKPGGR